MNFFTVFPIGLILVLDAICQKPDILKWVDQGGGEIVDDHVKQKVHFIVECHGVVSRSATDVQVTYVSTHWVKSCLEVCLKIGSTFRRCSLLFFKFLLDHLDHVF